MLQHRKDVEEIIEERKYLREMESQKELEELSKQHELTKAAQEIIAQERLKLIREHAPKLGKFLSERVANTEEEAKLIKMYLH